MHLASRLTSAAQEDRSARTLLGPGHPLVRVVHRMGVALERSCVVCGLACASGVALVEGVHAALALLLACAVVGLALGSELALLAPRRSDCALDIIVQGRADLPLKAVQHERGRLVERVRTGALADDYEAIRATALRSVPRPSTYRPVFHVRVVAAVEPELAAVAQRLQAAAPSLRGVAMAQRLITDGCSPLYGADVRSLREELRRIVFMLGA
jgi:hypothetical protein